MTDVLRAHFPQVWRLVWSLGKSLQMSGIVESGLVAKSSLSAREDVGMLAPPKRADEEESEWNGRSS